jgi:hypothetical protein
MILPVRLRPGIGCAGLLPIELIIVLCECSSGAAGTAEAPSGCPLAWVKQLRYNEAMNRFRRLRGPLFLTLVAVLVVVAAVLSLRGSQREATPAAFATSPLPPPVDTETSQVPPRSTPAVVLFWVVLGSMLALGVTFLVLRRFRRDIQ